MPRWTHVCIHHSFTGDTTLPDAVSIRRFHTSYRRDADIITESQYHELKEQGVSGLQIPWQDIGYHWVFERLSDGRPWMLKGRSMMKTGAHCKEAGMNRRAIGICVIGNFDIAPPPEDMLEMVADEVAWLCRMYRIPVENVVAHRDFATYKTCPGSKFDMNYFRERVAEYLEVWTPHT